MKYTPSNIIKIITWKIKYLFHVIHEYDIHPFRPQVIFDVGANNGNTFIDLARLFPWIQVHAFEPTPQLVEIIRSKTKSLKNYHLIPKAVGEVAGTTTFNVSGLGDWGCSSMLEFEDHLNETWKGREDLKVTEQITVDVITLKNYILENDIKTIDVLHIDTQGTDLKSLKSLGDSISIVQSGVVEVPNSNNVMLYKNQHSREEMMDFLLQEKFYIWKEVFQHNESNLYYRRKSLC